MARKSGLGKGLGALITADLVERNEVTSTPIDGPILRDIPVGSIEPNPHQPRVHFDESALSELTDSVRAIGVLQPVLVRPVADGKFQLIAGERRWRAATRAGLPTIPAVVRPTEDIGSVEQALVENLHRQDLTPLEEAAAYQQLLEDFSMTHEQVAARVGKSRSGITNALRLLTLPPAIQHLLADGRLSAGHAKAILGTPDRVFLEQLARRTVDEGWSVRAVEEAVRDRQGGKPTGEEA
ncbi:MAG: ParB/RepB/Spo0J family partition protein, partial [Actinomycetales bacterium]